MSDAVADPIFQTAISFMVSKYLFIANEIGLFEQLAAGPATLDELADRTSIPRTRLRILADAVVVLGLVERQGDTYSNGPAAAAYLSGQGALDLRPALRFWNQINYPMWLKLEDTLRTGQAQRSQNMTPAMQQIVSEGIEAIQAEPAQALPVAYDFHPHRRLLDLGGGTGSWLQVVLRQYSNLEGALFELPGAAAIARQRLARAGVKATVIEGDFFNDPIPEGYDAILLSNVFHLFTIERNLVLLRRIRQSTSNGAYLLLVDLWTNPTHTSPFFAAMMAGQFLLTTGEGGVYSEQEARDLLHESGWQALECKPLAGSTSLLVAQAI